MAAIIKFVAFVLLQRAVRAQLGRNPLIDLHQLRYVTACRLVNFWLALQILLYSAVSAERIWQ